MQLALLLMMSDSVSFVDFFTTSSLLGNYEKSMVH